MTKGSAKLAYIGDAVIEILIRKHLIETTDFSPNKMHKLALSFVSAKAQAEAMQMVFSNLTIEEQAVYKRGRNCKCGHIPKNADVAEYHTATGFEALIGYLFLKNDNRRITEILNLGYNINLQ